MDALFGQARRDDRLEIGTMQCQMRRTVKLFA
jgi:hypothetical protein